MAGVFAADESKQLHGPAVLADMKELLRLLTVCIHFSKKTFPQFLEVTGFTRDQVLLEEGRAGVRLHSCDCPDVLSTIDSHVFSFVVCTVAETSIYRIGGSSFAIHIAFDPRNTQYEGHFDSSHRLCGAFSPYCS